MSQLLPLEEEEFNYANIKQLSLVGFRIKLIRLSWKYLFTYYLPTGKQDTLGNVRKYENLHLQFPGLFVTVSSVSFLVPPVMYPARCVLLVTTLLVLVNMLNSVLTSTPADANGLTALSIWILACIGFVFVALLFYVFILVGMKRRMKKEATGPTADREGTEVDWDPGFLALHVASFTLFTVIYTVIIILL
jgi:hypothetical protein